MLCVICVVAIHIVCTCVWARLKLLYFAIYDIAQAAGVRKIDRMRENTIAIATVTAAAAAAAA